eukprot:gnl/TRDRNA2_/TRDRNA2_170789_c1_seq2.p1 gnl/TRDRNA2_/TRDRNA2_170789_c1~~gnl/TRDRNA2_/TRDRNA2_170789_c1_seq2.p1  ORF type:complete len:677 (-),score=98.14 gnl/TRDRNA2_/TRDRNA2_170789_c1_seq2:219-2183(-)
MADTAPPCQVWGFGRGCVPPDWVQLYNGYYYASMTTEPKSRTFEECHAHSWWRNGNGVEGGWCDDFQVYDAGFKLASGMDGKMIDGVYTRCDSDDCKGRGTAYFLPDGWQLAPEDPDVAKNVITDPNNPGKTCWGTAGLSFSNGEMYRTHDGSYGRGGELTGSAESGYRVPGGVQGAVLMRIAYSSIPTTTQTTTAPPSTTTTTLTQKATTEAPTTSTAAPTSCSATSMQCLYDELCDVRKGVCVKEGTRCKSGFKHDKTNRHACTVFKWDEFCAEQTAAKCLPKQWLVGQGFDFTQSTIEDLNENSRKYVVELKNEFAMKMLFGDPFLINEGAVAVANTGTVQSSTAAKFSSTMEAQKAQLAKLSASAKYGTVSGEASASYNSAVDNALSLGKTITEKEFTKNLYTVKVDSENRQVNSEFREAVFRLPKQYDPESPVNKESFRGLIRQYGTHYIDSITVGGSLIMKVEASSCTKDECISTFMAAEVCAKYEKGISAAEGCAEAQQADKTCNSVGKHTRQSFSSARGGLEQCHSIIPCDQNEWAKTVSLKDERSLVVVSSQIRPLWDALDESKMSSGVNSQEVIERRLSLKAALEHYVTENEKPSTEAKFDEVDCAALEDPDLEQPSDRSAVLGVSHVLCLLALAKVALHTSLN